MFHVPERNRVENGKLASDASYGNNGYFLISYNGALLHIIASDGEPMKYKTELWEHVSVHIEQPSYTDKPNEIRTPTWDEMCFVKEMFWDEEDCVVQHHPKKSEYVNRHLHTLHLWRPVTQTIPTPPKFLVG